MNAFINFAVLCVMLMYVWLAFETIKNPDIMNESACGCKESK